ncbi:MAG: MarR family transcriptional regulator [Christensenella sp.]|nr:MarR family transcriptional regulator [Christensenella sp.]
MENLIKKFSIIHRLSGIRLDQRLKDLGISRGQLMYIMCICDHEGISQEGLSCELRIDKGAVARAMQKLAGEGYITRVVSSHDRRQYNLFPTAKAKEIYAEVRAIDRQWQEQLTKGMNEKEKTELNCLLNKVMANLD